VLKKSNMKDIILFLSFIALAWSIANAMPGNYNKVDVDSVANYYQHFRCFDACFRLYSDVQNQLHERYECCKPCYRAIFAPNIVLLE